MFKKVLLTDGTAFKKSQQIYAKRPSDYWLVFFKTYVLSKERKAFPYRYFLFLIPFIVLLIVGFLFPNNLEDYLPPALIISVIITAIAFAISVGFVKHPFVHIPSLMHLVRFIIDLKGDIYRNLMSLKLNVSSIENETNLLDPAKIGLKKVKGVRYKPYELERYRARFQLMDGTVCMAALYQISLKVSTTKRRSSGKVKTKYKYKHKFLYVLTLKLKAEEYDVVSQNLLNTFDDTYSITNTTENGYHFLKIKQKEKLLTIATKPKFTSKIGPSNYSKMLAYLKSKKIFVPVAEKSLKQ